MTIDSFEVDFSILKPRLWFHVGHVNKLMQVFNEPGSLFERESHSWSQKLELFPPI